MAKKKLIEVALPLEAINAQSAREKSIRHGHPSTLHLWWARRPLATARAVLFAQLVDDPSERADEFRSEAADAGLSDVDAHVAARVDAERQRLFELITRMVDWDNLGDEELFDQVRAEIRRSTDGNPPAILDPAFMRKSGVSRDSGRSAINSGGLGAHDSGGKPSGFYDNSGVARSAAAAATARAVTAVASR